MYLIDTNVASELMQQVPAAAVAVWVAKQNAADLVLTAISEAELRYGVAVVPAGRRRNELEAAMTRWLELGFGGRILPFDSDAARHYADIASGRRRVGRPIGEADCQIAAICRSRGSAQLLNECWIARATICRSRGAALVTSNIRDFKDTRIEIINPWTAE